MTRKEFLIFWGLIALSAIPVIDLLKRSLESHAASPYTDSTATSGTLTGAATIVANSGASGGEAVRFGGPTSEQPLTPILWVQSSAYTGALTTDGFGGGYLAMPGTVMPFIPGGLSFANYQSTYQAAWTAATTAYHKAGLKLFLGIQPISGNACCPPGYFNVNSSNLLGSWNPNAVDKAGIPWGTYNSATETWTAGSYNEAWYQIGEVIAQCNFDGVGTDNEDGSSGATASVSTATTLTDGSTAAIITGGNTTGNATVSAGWSVSGTGIPSGTTVVSASGKSLVLSSAATVTGSETLTFQHFFICYQNVSVQYISNGYGNPASPLFISQYAGITPAITTTTEAAAQEVAWAKIAGTNLMKALQGGYHAAGGNAAIAAAGYSDVPMTGYNTGSAAFSGGYLNLVNNNLGTMAKLTSGGSVAWDTYYANYQTTAAVNQGMASQTTAPINIGQSLYYFPGIVTSTAYGAPFLSDADGGWARALAADMQSVIDNDMDTTIVLQTPMMHLADGSNQFYGTPGGTWSQASWDHAIGAILASAAISGAPYYNVWTTGGIGSPAATNVIDYANNANVSENVTSSYPNNSNGGGNQNYTPMDGVGTGVTGQPNPPWVSQVPQAPNLTQAVAGSGSVILTWQAPNSGPAPTSYTVVQGGATFAAYPGVTGLTKTITGLASGQSYRFLITGVNSTGTGLASTIKTVTAG